MKTRSHKIVCALITALIVFSNLFMLSGNSRVAKAQTIRQLPARIQIDDTPPDITISGGPSRIVGTGDFNGDGVSDILVGSDSAVYVFFGAQLRPPEITKAKYRKGASELSIFGTDLTGSARVEINGVVVDSLAIFEPDENKLVLQVKKSELNLRNGKNEVVVIRRGVRSNAIKLKV